jgi:hypothetical protein
MTTKTFEFYECEHEGDLQNYTNDIIKCGGTIQYNDVDYDREIGTVKFTVKDWKSFWEDFKQTETYEFLN